MLLSPRKGQISIHTADSVPSGLPSSKQSPPGPSLFTLPQIQPLHTDLGDPRLGGNPQTRSSKSLSLGPRFTQRLCPLGCQFGLVYPP